MSSEAALKILLLDDKYGKINSHWPYDTEKLQITKRIYYDDSRFLDNVVEFLENSKVNAIGLSGRKAPDALRKIENDLIGNKKLLDIFTRLPKVFKLHNTNLSGRIDNSKITREYLYRFGNDWVKAALDYTFDALLVQTHGDSQFFNNVLGKKVGFWVPYSFNDQLYYPRENKKMVDVAAYFKLERHDHRVEFVETIRNIVVNLGYSFEFSDQYWGEEYANKISEAKIVIHLSYYGDVPWRLYECAALKTCFLTDPLNFNVESLFSEGKDYIEYSLDLSDVAEKIQMLLSDDKKRNKIVENAYKRVGCYNWEETVNKTIVPILDDLLTRREVEYETNNAWKTEQK